MKQRRKDGNEWGSSSPVFKNYILRSKTRTLIALSLWERVGVRAYGGVNSSCLSVFECHWPLMEHE